MKRLTVVGALALGSSALAGDFEGKQPRELGSVRWHRQLDEALADAKSTGKPVFLVFQEIPGCGTCVGFGQRVLSHPVLADAIENEFVPLAIHNNKGGHDGEVLKKYDEPAWNNPVVRFLDAQGKDVIARKDGVFDAGDVGARMIATLEAAKRPVPAYLRLAVSELRAARAEKATFAMACYWEGESQLGALDGVLATRTGSLEGREVVEVLFDPAVVSLADLGKKAAAAGCASIAGNARDASHSDQKYYLERSPLRFLPLTPLQATRINSALRFGRDGSEWLGPREQALAKRIEQVLAAKPGALDDLARPDSLPDLAEYEARLSERLDASLPAKSR